MVNLLSVSWEDVYEYTRCPKILSYKAYQSLKAGPQLPPRRSAEPAGSQEETFETERLQISSGRTVKETVARTRDELNGYLKHVVDTSLKGAEDVSRILRKEYGDIEVLATGEAKHPDLACVARPSYVAFTSDRSRPILVEVKNARQSKDEFKAKFYNGLADASGVFVIKQRLEDGVPRLDSYISNGQSETVLVYPRSCKVVREKFVVDVQLAKKVALAKQLGYSGVSPETDCGPDCVHHRSKVKLPTGNLETLRLLPLIMGEGLLQRGFDLDTYHQVYYGWELLEERGQYFENFQEVERRNWKGWLVDTVRLDEKAADFLAGDGTYHPWDPDAETMLKHLGHEGEMWQKILEYRLKLAAISLLGKTKSVYALPKGSSGFLKGAIKRWQ